MAKYKLGIIGAGFMSTAITKGIIGSAVLKASNVIISDLSSDALAKVSQLGVDTTTSNTYLVENSEFVLFAVKPQNFNSATENIGSKSLTKIITIMAGIKKERIRKSFPGVLIARCMPNTPCSIASGAMGLDVTEFSDDDKNFITRIFSSLGQVVFTDENKLNAVTGISGSAPAYFYLFADSLIKAGMENGLTEEESKTLVVNTMIGSGKMILQNSEQSTEQLVNAVCSKGGTTIEAVNVYKEQNLYDITSKAVKACIKRAYELENQ